MRKWFNVGKIVNTHGLRGEVRVMSRTDFPEERFKKGSVLYIWKKDAETPIKVEVSNYRTHKGFHLVTFVGYPNINDVEVFKDSMLKITEEDLMELEEDEFYYHELIGCDVVTDKGRELGKIKEILSPGANDVWVVKAGKKEYLIPYIKDVVLDVNISEKLVKIHEMEGLLS